MGPFNEHCHHWRPLYVEFEYSYAEFSMNRGRHGCQCSFRDSYYYDISNIPMKAMNDERVETIISVKEREEEKKSDEKGTTEKKKDAKTGDKKEGELVKKEKAEEGALSLDIFKSYFRAFGWGWSMFYIFWSLAYQAGDIIYSIWLSTWVDAIPYYDTLKSDGSKNCIKIIPGEDQDTARIGSILDFVKP